MDTKAPAGDSQVLPPLLSAMVNVTPAPVELQFNPKHVDWSATRAWPLPPVTDIEGVVQLVAGFPPKQLVWFRTV
jgi:hypothetical protein